MKMNDPLKIRVCKEVKEVMPFDEMIPQLVDTALLIRTLVLTARIENEVQELILNLIFAGMLIVADRDLDPP